MAQMFQIRGMLAEEILIHLLRRSGYRPIMQKGSDTTLESGPAGNKLYVRGRGANHQVDAIADFAIQHPFTYPQRLLVESKFYATNWDKVEIEVVRNLVGVIKDVSEFWAVHSSVSSPVKRYHYEAALFSPTGFSKNAQEYAFAQDVFLIPIQRTRYLRDTLHRIRDLTYAELDGTSDRKIPIDLWKARMGFRRLLSQEDLTVRLPDEETNSLHPSLAAIASDFATQSNGLLVMIDGRIPLLLVANPDIPIDQLYRDQNVRIYYSDDSWYIHAADNRERLLFSFDLPQELIKIHHMAQQSGSPNIETYNMKRDLFRTIHALVEVENRFRLVTYSLDEDWLNALYREAQAER